MEDILVLGTKGDCDMFELLQLEHEISPKTWGGEVERERNLAMTRYAHIVSRYVARTC